MSEPYDISYREHEHGQTPATAPGSIGRGMAANIAKLSRWIDDYPPNAERDREAAAWGRITKAGEELGEVIKEMIAATDQNPRKPKARDFSLVIDESLDVIISALGGVEHLTGNEGKSIALLEAKLAKVVDRAFPKSELQARADWASERQRTSPACTTCGDDVAFCGHGQKS